MQLKKVVRPVAVAKAENKPEFDSVELKRVPTEISTEDLDKKSSTIPEIEKVLYVIYREKLSGASAIEMLDQRWLTLLDTF